MLAMLFLAVENYGLSSGYYGYLRNLHSSYPVMKVTLLYLGLLEWVLDAFGDWV